jgi:hypothetical protein
MEIFTIVGVEHLYDEFDNYEYPNMLPNFQFRAASVEEAKSRAEEILRTIIQRERYSSDKGLPNKGWVTSEIVQIINEKGQIVYQGTDTLTMGFGRDQNTWKLTEVGYGPVGSKISPELILELGLEDGKLMIITPEQFRAEGLIIRADDTLIRFLDQHPEKVFSLTPRQFEELVAELLSKFGYSVKVGPRGADGGVDVFAEREGDFGHELVLAQCKKYGSEKKITCPQIKKFKVEVYDRNASRGLLVTTSYFTKPALDYIEQVKYRLAGIDYEHLKKLFRKLRELQ